MTVLSYQAAEPAGVGAAGRAAPDARRDPAAGRVTFKEVTKSFNGPEGPITALDKVTFTVEPGEVFGIIGRSGAGKSTLIRTVNRLETPTSGEVLVGGADVVRLGEDELVQLRRRTGMIFQHFNLLSAKTVIANVALPLRIAGWTRAQAWDKAEELLDLVGLTAKRDVYPAKLSGGQKQRVGIARALVHGPSILLCDEATSALDPETTQSILGLLRDINARLGLTVILITHEMSVIRDVCDRVAVLERGRLVEEGPVWRVFGAPQADATQALLRTVVHDLPDEIAGRLRPDPTGARTVLLDIRYSGEDGGDPDIGLVAGALGRSVRLVHGSVERIRGRAQGRLIVAAEAGDPAALEARLSVIRAHAHHVSVLGYADDL